MEQQKAHELAKTINHLHKKDVARVVIDNVSAQYIMSARDDFYISVGDSLFMFEQQCEAYIESMKAVIDSGVRNA